jgi:hypothetical protein
LFGFGPPDALAPPPAVDEIDETDFIEEEDDEVEVSVGTPSAPEPPAKKKRRRSRRRRRSKDQRPGENSGATVPFSEQAATERPLPSAEPQTGSVDTDAGAPDA